MIVRIVQFLLGALAAGGGGWLAATSRNGAASVFPPGPEGMPWLVIAGVLGLSAGVTLLVSALHPWPERRARLAAEAAHREATLGAADTYYAQNARERAADRDWRSGDLPPPAAPLPAASASASSSSAPSAGGPSPDASSSGALSSGASFSATPSPVAGEGDTRARPAPVAAPANPAPLAAGGPAATPAPAAPPPAAPVRTVAPPPPPPPSRTASPAPPPPVAGPAAPPAAPAAPGAAPFPSTATLAPIPPAAEPPPVISGGPSPASAPAAGGSLFPAIRSALAEGRLEEAEGLLNAERTRAEGLALAELTGLAGDHAAAAGRASHAKWLWRLALSRFGEHKAMDAGAARAVAESLRTAG